MNMTEFAILNRDNEVIVAKWFATIEDANAFMLNNDLDVTDTHTGEVCPRHDEAGKDGCKYCAANKTSGPADVSTITEYGLTQKLSNCIRCY